MSASVRCAMGLVWPGRADFFWTVVMSISWGCRGRSGSGSVVDVAGAGGCVDAALPLDVAALAGDCGSDGTVAEVADAALAQRQDAAHADAHAAPAGHKHPGGLGRVEDRRRAVEVERGARGEAHGAAVAGLHAGGAELLGREGEPGGLVVGGQRVEQAGRTAGERRPLGQVGHEMGEVGDVEDAVLVVVARHQADGTRRVEGLEVADEDRVGVAGSDVHDHDVVVGAPGRPQHAVVGAGKEVAQHADDGRDPRPGGDHQELAALRRQHELARRLLEVHHRAGLGTVDEVVAHQAVRDGLHGDRDPAVATRTVGQGVGAPLAYAVDVDADAEVLARHVSGPVRAGADHDRGGVGGLRGDRIDPPAQGGAGAQRSEEVQEVGRQVGRGGSLSDPDQLVPEAGAPHGRLHSRAHVPNVADDGQIFLPSSRESRVQYCSLRTKPTSGVPMAPRGVPSTTQVQTVVGLDPVVAEALRTRLAEVADSAVLTIVDEVPSYAGAWSGRMGEVIRNAVQLALGGFLTLATRQDVDTPKAPAIEGAYQLGRGEARSGRTVEAFLAAYRIGARASWRDMSGVAVEAGVDAGQLARFAELVFAYIDELSAASVAGHTDELESSGRVRQRNLERLARALLTGAPADAINAAAERAGWEPPPALTAVVLQESQVSHALTA